MKQLEWQIERERNEMLAGQTTPAIRPVMRGDISSMLPRTSDEDPLVFFSAFERALQLNGVDKVDWPKFLASCLTVKANKVLAGLSLAENKDFEACKRAILNYFRLDAPAYQKKFRQARKGHDETYNCLLYTSPSPRDGLLSRMPSSA